MDAVIMVDSNIFIFGETESAPERDLAMRRYAEACNSDRIGTNVIILSEVFHFCKRIGGAEVATQKVKDILNTPETDFVDFSPESVMNAAKLARDFQLRINDALIAQQAIEKNAAVLTDNVKDFGKIKAIRLMPLKAP